jgi:hypothetical protein
MNANGPTALGPAILTSIAMASQGSKGSSVVICTDGLANVGLGSLENLEPPGKIEEANDFYLSLGQYAKFNGVSVNLITIKGEECQLGCLMQIAEEAGGGEVDILDPMDLINNFSKLLTKKVIASNVNIKIKLHRLLKFRNEIPAFFGKNGVDDSTFNRWIGNVTEESILTFEYTFKNIAKML